MKKRNAQKRHAKERLFDRFGIHAGNNDLLAAVQAIQHGKSRLVERQSNRVVLHEVRVNGMTVIAVYDTIRKSIASFLRPDMYRGEGVVQSAQAKEIEQCPTR